MGPWFWFCGGFNAFIFICNRISSGGKVEYINNGNLRRGSSGWWCRKIWIHFFPWTKQINSYVWKKWPLKGPENYLNTWSTTKDKRTTSRCVGEEDVVLPNPHPAVQWHHREDLTSRHSLLEEQRVCDPHQATQSWWPALERQVPKTSGLQNHQDWGSKDPKGHRELRSSF